MSEWRPIESAPKDGTHILLVQDGRFVVSRWQDESYEKRQLISSKGKIETYEWVPVSDGHWDHGDFDIFAPTHWMPLPEPPQ